MCSIVDFSVAKAILSICIAMSFFYTGLVRGFSAPAIPSIMENDPDLLPTKNIASWASKRASLPATALGREPHLIE